MDTTPDDEITSTRPGIVDLGHISELTLGQGGSTCDGGGDLTQTGGGNDEAPTDCGPPGGGGGNGAN